MEVASLTLRSFYTRGVRSWMGHRDDLDEGKNLATAVMIYLMTLSVDQTTQRLRVGWLLKNEMEGIWKEATGAKFDMLNRYLPAETEENHGKSSR